MYILPANTHGRIFDELIVYMIRLFPPTAVNAWLDAHEKTDAMSWDFDVKAHETNLEQTLNQGRREGQGFEGQSPPFLCRSNTQEPHLLCMVCATLSLG